MRAEVVRVAYPRDFDGSDPDAWALAHPDSCYPFLWPASTLPRLGTQATTDRGVPVIVVGHGHPGTFKPLKTLVAPSNWTPA